MRLYKLYIHPFINGGQKTTLCVSFKKSLSSANVLPYNSKYAKRNYVKDNTLFIQIGFQTADIYNKT